MTPEPLLSEEFHACLPPPGEEHARRWWTDEALPWRVCMFCGVRQMKSGRDGSQRRDDLVPASSGSQRSSTENPLAEDPI